MSFHLSDKAPWADKGHEVAWEQWKLPVAAPPKPLLTADGMPPVSCTRQGDLVRVTGSGFELVFDGLRGSLSSWTLNGRLLLTPDGGPALQVFRAPVDNDLKSSYVVGENGWYAVGLHQLEPTLEAFSVDDTDSDKILIRTVIHWDGKRQTGFRHECVYTVWGNGWVHTENAIEPYGDLPVLPRLGVRFALPGSYGGLEWYGRGPFESYPDRKAGAALGRYRGRVGDQAEPYIFPQETGNKEDVRWASLINEDGDGLLIVPDTPLSFSALPFTSDDLDQAKHQHELISKDEVFVSIDFKQNGLGNKSCGPEPLEMYLLHPRPVRFGYSLRPISGTREKPEVLARFVFDPKLANAHLDAEETREWIMGNRKADYIDPSDPDARRQAGYSH